LVAAAFSILLFGLSKLPPNDIDTLVAILPGDLGATVLAGALSSVVVLALVFFVTGARNDTVRSALRPVFLDRLNLRTTRRKLAVSLKTYFDESFDRLVTTMNDLPLQVDHAIAGGVLEWLRDHSHSHRKAQQELASLRHTVLARCQVFDEFIDLANQRLSDIPAELRETAAEIKSDVIEEHLSRIRNAATSVENVRSDVQRVADIASSSH